MSNDTNKARVGAFVLGGLGLLILAVVALGRTDYFDDTSTYVMYFEGSVSGLSTGAPVVFRGVPFGHVTQISLVAKADTMDVTIPVYVQLNASSVVGEGKDYLDEDHREEILHNMIQRGLRARLQLQSFITGQYRIELDFFPDTPARYISANRRQEIPTMPSPLDELQRTLANIPVAEIVHSVEKTLARIEQIASNPDIPYILSSLRSTLDSSASIVAELTPLRDDLRRMVNTANAQLPEAVGAFQLAMNSLAAAAGQIDKTAAQVNVAVRGMGNAVASDSRTMRELHAALKEFSEAARAFRALSSMLERHPESLLYGKGGKR